MDVAVLLPVSLLALLTAMVITMYEMRTSLRPTTCPECSHCRAAAEADARERERLAHEYARSVGLRDDDEHDDRKIG